MTVDCRRAIRLLLALALYSPTLCSPNIPLPHRVFYKVKSRNAHMKSHRPPDAESKRKGAPQRQTPPSPQSQRPRAKLTAAHHLSELSCLEPSMLSLPNQGYVIPNM